MQPGDKRVLWRFEIVGRKFVVTEVIEVVIDKVNCVLPEYFGRKPGVSAVSSRKEIFYTGFNDEDDPAFYWSRDNEVDDVVDAAKAWSRWSEGNWVDKNGNPMSPPQGALVCTEHRRVLWPGGLGCIECYVRAHREHKQVK